jgi:hypothetical protein
MHPVTGTMLRKCKISIFGYAAYSSALFPLLVGLSERLYFACRRNYGMQTHVARYAFLSHPDLLQCSVGLAERPWATDRIWEAARKAHHS